MEMDKALSMVLDTLRRASSQNQDILKPAEEKLQEWETEPGFYSILLVSCPALLKLCISF